MPSQVDLPQLLLILLDAFGSGLQRVAVGEELQRFPPGLQRGLKRAAHAPEHIRIRTELASSLEDRRQPSLRIERDSAVLLVFRGSTGNTDLAGVPVHALVLNQEHLAAPATEFQRADDPVVEQLPRELMF